MTAYFSSKALNSNANADSAMHAKERANLTKGYTNTTECKTTDNNKHKHGYNESRVSDTKT
jgi:hypothetical protein